MIHLHGARTCCPCGAETGMASVRFPEDYVRPATCRTCGKPADRWGDGRSWRTGVEHEIGCGEHPGTTALLREEPRG